MPNYVFIYALLEPDIDDVRYVGKATDPFCRLRSHLTEKRATRKVQWIQSLVRQCKLPRLVILEATDKAHWEHCEQSWISFYRSIGADLTNHTDGGDGLTNASPETREKLRRNAKTRMADPVHRAKVFTAERNAKISQSLRGKRKTASHVAKLPQNRPGRQLTEEHKALIKARTPIRQLSETEIEQIRQRMIGNTYGIGGRSRTGQTQSVDERLKKSLASRGIAKSLEHRAKISESMRDAWKTRQTPRDSPSPIVWPDWSWIQEQLKTMTIKELALRLRVKAGTLGAHIFRRSHGKPVVPSRGPRRFNLLKGLS